jgi:hypothetical protein
MPLKRMPYYRWHFYKTGFTAQPGRVKISPFATRRFWFGPIRNTHQYKGALVVEPPGTAPGSAMVSIRYHLSP